MIMMRGSRLNNTLRARLRRSGKYSFMTFDEVINELKIAKGGLSKEDQQDVNALVWIDDNLK